MGVGPKLRFDIFKRDDFTCRYCGRKTPQVVLEVDHIIPRAEGGGNEIENLVTSCFECNRGKGAGLLDDAPVDTDIHEKTVLLAERELQLREYNEMKRRIRAREDDHLVDLHDYWEELAGSRRDVWYPDWRQLRGILRLIPAEDIKDAMEIAAHKKPYFNRTTCKYLFGILWRMRQERLGERDPIDEGGIV